MIFSIRYSFHLLIFGKVMIHTTTFLQTLRHYVDNDITIVDDPADSDFILLLFTVVNILMLSRSIITNASCGSAKISDLIFTVVLQSHLTIIVTLILILGCHLVFRN